MGTETSSTPQNGLSSLFMGNQPTQTGQQNTLPTITAPQSLIAQGLLPQPVLHPVNVPPPAPPAAPPEPPKDPFGQYMAGGGWGGR